MSLCSTLVFGAIQVFLCSAARAQSSVPDPGGPIVRTIVAETADLAAYRDALGEGLRIMRELGAAPEIRVVPREIGSESEVIEVHVVIEYPDRATRDAWAAILRKSGRYATWLESLENLRRVLADRERVLGARAPLLSGIGNHHRAITTCSSFAQRYFDQGLSLYYGSHYVDSVPSFQEAIDADPDCAMAWWGLALAIGPNPSSRDFGSPDDPEGLGLQALTRAVERKDGAAPLERALIGALHARYDAESRPGSRERDLAYARAMREIHVAHPEDPDVATLYGESRMMLSPWRYWYPDGSGRPGAEEARRALRHAIDLDPRHPGAHHFFIHLMEDSPDPSVALPSALVLEGLMPDVGHIVHLPSRIYLQLGRYREAIRGNLASLAADRRMLAQWGDRERPWDVPSMGMGADSKGLHARCFLHLAALRLGDFDLALEAGSAACGGLEPELGVMNDLRMQVLCSNSWMTYRSFGRWQEILDLPQTPPSVPFARAIRLALRGSAWLALGDLENAVEELRALETVANEVPGPLRGLIEIPLQELAGLVAEARGETEDAVGHLEGAVRMEDSMPGHELPLWQHPVRLTLGHVLLRAGRPREAVAVFRENLRRNPEDGRTLFGLRRALQELGDEEQAALIAARFRDAWGGTEDPVVLGFVARPPSAR